MPRFSGKDQHSDTFTFHVKVNMQPTLYEGLRFEDLGGCPIRSTVQQSDSSGHGVSKCIVENVNSGILGSYSFDFTRLLVSQSLLINNFQQVRIRSASMSIRRVDDGSQFGVANSFDQQPKADGSPSGFYNLMQNPMTVQRMSPLVMHYLRVPASMSMTSDYVRYNAQLDRMDYSVFMNDPRRRSVNLYPGRKVKFNFLPYSYDLTHITTVARGNGGGPVQERDRTRTISLPSKLRPIGWHNTAIHFPIGQSDTYNNPQPQLTHAIRPFHLLSGTLLILFDSQRLSDFVSNLFEVVDPGGELISNTTTFSSIGAARVRRDESITFDVRGLRTNSSYFPGYVSQVVPYNGNTPNDPTTSTVQESVAPIWAGSIQSVPGIDANLVLSGFGTTGIMQPFLPVVDVVVPAAAAVLPTFI